MALVDSLCQLENSGFSRTRTGVAIGDETDGCIIEEWFDSLNVVIIQGGAIVGHCQIPKECTSWQELASKLANGLFGNRAAFEAFRSRCTEEKMWDFFDFIQYGIDYEDGGWEQTCEGDVNEDENVSEECPSVSSTHDENEHLNEIEVIVTELLSLLEQVCESFKTIKEEMWKTISNASKVHDIKLMKYIVDVASEVESIGVTLEHLKMLWENDLEGHGKNHVVVDVESLGREHTLSTSKSYGDDYVAKLIRIHELRKLATEIVRNEGEPIVERDMCPECSKIQSSFEYFETGLVEDAGETVDGYDDDDWITEVVENGRPWYYAFSLDGRHFLMNGDNAESLEIDS